MAFFPTRNSKHQQTFCTAYANSVIPIIQQEPGFVSCDIYRSMDGTKVALSEKWESVEACRQSYRTDSLPTAIRTSLKYVLEVDESLVNRHVYQRVIQIPSSSDNKAASANAAGVVEGPCPLVHFGILHFSSPSTTTSTQPDPAASVLVDLLTAKSAATTTAPSSLLSSMLYQSVDTAQVVSYGQWATSSSSTSTDGAAVLSSSPLWPSLPQIMDPVAFEAYKSYWENIVVATANDKNDGNTSENNHSDIQHDYQLYALVSWHRA